MADVLNLIKAAAVQAYNDNVPYEVNDSATREHAVGHISAALHTFSEISNYRVVCDSSNNDQQTIADGNLRVDVAVVIRRTVFLNFTIDKNGIVNY